MNPRIEALAFRIWREASTVEWNLTVQELAERLDVSLQRVNQMCIQRGWSRRLRSGYFSNKQQPSQIGGYYNVTPTIHFNNFILHDGLPGRANERPDE